MKRFVQMTLMTAVLAAAAFGTWTAAQNKFGTPTTIIHVSLIQWKAGVSDADKKKALEGVKDMAGKIPGMRNVWTKAIRIQPEGYHDAFVIEFENQAAADRYAKDPVHDAWTKEFIAIREASISPQITNE
jgi:hypothetical protein